jgi:hypothetical protein
MGGFSRRSLLSLGVFALSLFGAAARDRSQLGLGHRALDRLVVASGRRCARPGDGSARRGIDGLPRIGAGEPGEQRLAAEAPLSADLPAGHLPLASQLGQIRGVDAQQAGRLFEREHGGCHGARDRFLRVGLARDGVGRGNGGRDRQDDHQAPGS